MPRSGRPTSERSAGPLVLPLPPASLSSRGTSKGPMKYRVVLEHDPDTRHYTATVPGLPGLFVDGPSEAETLKMAKEGIAFYLKELASKSGMRRVKPLPSKVVTVDL